MMTIAGPLDSCRDFSPRIKSRSSLEPLRSYSNYNPTTESGYQDLYDFLLDKRALIRAKSVR